MNRWWWLASKFDDVDLQNWFNTKTEMIACKSRGTINIACRKCTGVMNVPPAENRNYKRKLSTVNYVSITNIGHNHNWNSIHGCFLQTSFCFCRRWKGIIVPLFIVKSSTGVSESYNSCVVQCLEKNNSND